MNICIDANELRKALVEIEQAEANGFNYCLSVFRLSSAGRMLDQCRMEYSDLLERAHPTDGNLNWGRFQSVTKYNKFVNGSLVPIDKVNKVKLRDTIDSDTRFDLDWLDGVADGAMDNILSVGRAERIAKYVRKLQKELYDV